MLRVTKKVANRHQACARLVRVKLIECNEDYDMPTIEPLVWLGIR